METVYFLIFIGICAFVLVWATRTSKSKTDLASSSRNRKRTSSSDKLKTPVDSRLSHRDELWELRKKHAAKGDFERQNFIPKSVSGGDPEYDGYSRRDRHHLARGGHVKEEAHVNELDESARPVA